MVQLHLFEVVCGWIIGWILEVLIILKNVNNVRLEVKGILLLEWFGAAVYFYRFINF